MSSCNNPNCQEAADRAVKKVFAILGVDIDRPESVEEFREDLRFGKRMRKGNGVDDIIDPASVPAGVNPLQYADPLICGK